MADIDYGEIQSIAGTSRATFQVLKKKYFPLLDQWFHIMPGVGSLLARRGGEIGGEQGIWAVFDEAPQSAGHRPEGWKLPTPVGSTSKKPSLISRDQYLRIRVTGKLKRSARGGDSVAWRKPLQAELEMAKQQLEIDFATNLCRGNYQILGIVKSHTTGGGVSILTIYGANDRRHGVENNQKLGAFAAYLKVNKRLGFLDKSASANLHGSPIQSTSSGTANEVYITAISESDPDNPTLTLSADLSTAFTGSTAPADGDRIIPYASRLDTTTATQTAATQQAEFFGFNGKRNIIDDGTYGSFTFGLAKGTVKGVTAKIHHDNANQREFTSRWMEFAMSERRKQTGAVTDTMLLNPDQLREVSAENRGNRRFEPVISKEGYQRLAVVFNDMQAPYIEDWVVEPGEITGFAKRDFMWLEEFPLGPIDETGTYRFRPDYDENEIIAVKGGNIFHNGPWKTFEVADLMFSTTAPRNV